MQMTEETKKTPLYETHVTLGARMIAFAGFWMPRQYTTMIEEHLAVRKHAGLFDISHMGEFLVTGVQAEDFLATVLTGDLRTLRDGETLYTLLCNESGGVVDDLMVYRMKQDRFMLVVNAANIQKDYMWITSHLSGRDVRCENLSDHIALLALQGPFAEPILRKTPYHKGSDLHRNRFVEFEIGEKKLLISRTGYTGEDGFELYTSPEFSAEVWETFIDCGKEMRLQPIGLGARDTLRLEARLPLYGHDLDDETTPFEAGIGWTVSLQKETFIGKEALSRQKKEGPKRRLVGFEMLEKGIPRERCLIWKEKAIGKVTSGSFSPSLQKNIGLGYVPTDAAAVGAEFLIEIREKKLRARIVETPFYKRSVS